MFRDFEKTKNQLAELADIINKFKSEAVQLRLVELLLGESEEEEVTPSINKTEPTRRVSRKRAKPTSTEKSSEDPASSKKKSATGSGAVSTLIKIYQGGYFKQPRTIGDICTHCETNLARKIKPNEISGKLGRMVRNGELSRTKNSDGQYVYTKA